MEVYPDPRPYLAGLRATAIKEGREPIPMTRSSGPGLVVTADYIEIDERGKLESEAEYGIRRAEMEETNRRIDLARAAVLPGSIVIKGEEADEYAEFLKFKAAKAQKLADEAALEASGDETSKTTSDDSSKVDAASELLGASKGKGKKVKAVTATEKPEEPVVES